MLASELRVRQAAHATPNVLFIDDDENLLESLKVVLRQEPYTILTAVSVEEAKRYLDSHRIDVIVCDDRLPTQNGTAFLATLKQADIKHVQHALRFLKPDGLLTSVMSAGVSFRDNRLTQDFRDLIRARGGDIEALPEGAFKASGTMVNTIIATIPGGA